MAVRYRRMEFNDKIVIQSEVINLCDNNRNVFDSWSGFVDRKGDYLYYNDIVIYEGELYTIIKNGGEIMFRPISKRLDWYDEIVINNRIAQKCRKKTSFWEYMAYEYKRKEE